MCFELLRSASCAQGGLEVYAPHQRTGSSFVSSLVLWLHAMTLYKYVQKFSKEKQKFESFHPLRVAGLAYEVGWKFVHKRGGSRQCTCECPSEPACRSHGFHACAQRLALPLIAHGMVSKWKVHAAHETQGARNFGGQADKTKLLDPCPINVQLRSPVINWSGHAC